MAHIETTLLVDDSRVTRMFVERILQPYCGSVLVAGGAAEAIEIIGAGREVSLVISDVYMAAGDGFRLLRDLQELDNAPGALLMTGRTISDEDRARAQALGAIGFLKKPVRVRDILDAWNAYYERKPERRGARVNAAVNVVLRLLEDEREALSETRTHDIGIDGVFVETEGPIPEGTGVSVEVRPVGASPIVVEGEVIRVQQPDWMRRGGVAVRFSEGQEVLAELRSLLKDYDFLMRKYDGIDH